MASQIMSARVGLGLLLGLALAPVDATWTIAAQAGAPRSANACLGGQRPT